MIENLVARILKKVAPAIGARVVMEPKWRKVGQIIFKSGRKRYFRYSTLDVNRTGAAEVARDKDYAKFFMARMGYPVIPGKAFCADKWAAAIGSKDNMASARAYAQKLGWPVVVKPNSKSQGRSVFKVHSRREFEFACRAVARMDQMILVERFIAGRDYRVVVLDGKIISAYERIALSIVGDGKISIRSLLTAKQKEFVRLGRDTVLKPDDCRIFGKLERQGLSFQSRPAKGRKVYLLDNANLSSGGDSEDITRRIHRGFREIAARVTADMGLRLCGVDFMIDGDICDAPKPGHYWIIEINSAPGLDHYAAIGARQRETVERLYTRVLRAMDTEV